MSDSEHPTSTELSSWVGGGPFFRPPSPGSVATWAIITLTFALVVPGMMRSGGSFMEEGFSLVFPERLRAGDVPNVDFLYLYGPGTLHALAAWFEITGTSLTSQRVFAVLQMVAGTAAVISIARPTGRFLATVAGLCFLAMMITTTGLAALAWPGAFALALWGVAFGLRSRHLHGTTRTRAALLAGLLTGLALSCRPDMIVAVALGWGVLLLWKVPYRPALVGALCGLLPMWVHLAIAGIGPVWQGVVVDPVSRLRPGRRLPVPPSWSFIDGALQALGEIGERPWWGLPAFRAEHQIVLWFWFVLVANIAVPVVLAVYWRRQPAQRPIVEPLLAAAAFGVGLTGQALQRADSAHLAWGGVVSFALLAPTTAVVLGGRDRIRQMAAPLATVSAVLLVLCPFFTLRPYLNAFRVTVGDRPSGYEVVRDGRRFLSPDLPTQRASQAAVDQLAALSSPGERLLVGPADLRRTIYNDVVFYHLFPDLEPATYFIEMDPGLADLPTSSLADDVRGADWLILTNFWTWWFEPNDSSVFHENGANEAVADDFCLVGDYEDGLVLLFHRCDPGDGIDPSTVGIGPDRRRTFEQQRLGRLTTDESVLADQVPQRRWKHTEH